MDRAYDITSDKSSLRVQAGARDEVIFTITNKSGADQPTRVRAVSNGDVARDWLQFADGGATAIANNGSQSIKVVVAIPTSAKPGAGRGFRLDAYSDQSPDLVFSEGPSIRLEIDPAAAPAVAPKSRAWLWWVIAAVVVIGAGATLWTLLPKPVTDEAPADAEIINVMLERTGSDKIAVIKAVRELTGLGLKEAKDLVDRAPTRLLERVSRERGEEARIMVQKAGGAVKFVKFS